MNNKIYKVQAVATMLGISVDTVRRDSDEANIKVERQGAGPKARLFSIENVFELAAYRARKYGKKAARKLIITIYAPKGGVGKTTKSSNFASLFALMGYRVLVVDLDFQANLTVAFGYDPELTVEEAQEFGLPDDIRVDYHLGHLMPQWNGDGRVASLDEVIKKPYGEHGPHVIPAEVSLDRLETLFTMDALMNKKPDMAIAKMLREGRSGDNPNLDLSGYDIILFDAPPAKNQSTRGALLASDYVIAPVSMERFSTKSISYLSRVLTEMLDDYNKFPELIILGNFCDMRRTRVNDQIATITSKYPDAWLDRQVASSEEFRKALSDDVLMPLVLSRPTSTPAEELREVAKALVQRMGIAA